VFTSAKPTELDFASLPTCRCRHLRVVSEPAIPSPGDAGPEPSEVGAVLIREV